MNEYPRDEFDDVSEHTRREGAHRSFVQLRDPRSGLWALIICGLVALIIGALMYFVVRPSQADRVPSAEETTSSSTGAAASTKTPATTAPSSTAGSSTDGSEPAASTEASATAPSATEAPSSTPVETSETPSTSASAGNTALSVGVYNGTKVSGLAQQFSGTLTTAGYSAVKTDNWTRSAATSTVYYMSEAELATAQDIASKLGISSIVQTTNIPRPVSVVLGSDKLTR